MISAIPIPQRVNHAQDILDIRHCSGLTKGTNGESVTTVTIAVPEVYVICRAADRQAIISVEDDVVLEKHIRTLSRETYQTGTLSG